MKNETEAVAERKELLDVHEVSHMMGCSPRHVYRLSDGGRMPAPMKLGALARWRREELEQWISGGCKAVRSVTRKGAVNE